MLLALFVACGGGQPAEPPAADVSEAQDWLAVVAKDPAAFAALTTPELKDGWVAMSQNDPRAAAAAFQGTDPVVRRSRARAELAVAEVYRDLDQSRAITFDKTRNAYTKRGTEVPATVAELWTIDERCDDAGSIDDVPSYTERAALHRDATTNPAALAAALTEPYATDDSDGFERKLYDPCGYATLARVWEGRAEADGSADLGGEDEGLESLLFSPWLTPEDVLGYTPRPFDVEDSAGLLDDAQAAREHVRALDAALDAHVRGLVELADDDGRSLLVDIGMPSHFRQAWLVTRARTTLGVGRPHQGLAYAEMAIDVSDRTVGPKNSPSAFAVLAQAQLSAGHTRESLGSLQPLSADWPEVNALVELAGDLAVLEGLDRSGDSKEN